MVSQLQPIPIDDLAKIATETCDKVLADIESYDHEKVSDWSSKIINQVLQTLISATTSSPDSSSTTTTTTPPSEPQKLSYRFNVNCTIIQQGLTHESGAKPSSVEETGRRGMHAASGAYWDVKRDGMWTYKYPNGADKGLDLVLNVVWFGV
ncbi:hypothetical protein LOY97_000273 [Ophidiomyces ophidiicola]|nr:hypothetical protein LOZ49_001282 [Ophidiomyces ophidiicola]KAI2022407.1 hypothetical protein LOZ46_001890 [Ophidiomyces ophidiicola]KAI2055285.1 hypothetical protein LOZ44_002169 [Ophidiomyces ophidiicola]KAI2143354.1 hypothetical protein LOZ29_001112 [Ophidiomyces ophidiicola]KAI2146069.1 hypothetical protein LOZ28_000873 [Ophidiomyces ophidiicola]